MSRPERELKFQARVRTSTGPCTWRNIPTTVVTACDLSEFFSCAYCTQRFREQYYSDALFLALFRLCIQYSCLVRPIIPSPYQPNISLWCWESWSIGLAKTCSSLSSKSFKHFLKFSESRGARLGNITSRSLHLWGVESCFNRTKVVSSLVEEYMFLRVAYFPSPVFMKDTTCETSERKKGKRIRNCWSLNPWNNSSNEVVNMTRFSKMNPLQLHLIAKCT